MTNRELKTLLDNLLFPAHTPCIKNVYFNPPYTIVMWSDKTKTIVKKSENDVYDPEKGLAMAVSKKFLGTNKTGSNYYDYFKKWLPEVTTSTVEVNLSCSTCKYEDVDLKDRPCYDCNLNF